jgi:hypothetical protein
MLLPKRKYHTLFFILCIVIYVCAVTAYSIYSNYEAKRTTIQEIDNKLLLASKSLKHMLAPDFHDRAVSQDSISREEELKNRASISSFSEESEFEWLYTLAEKEGNFYFTAPTVSEEEAKERDTWYFYPYNDIPNDFIEAYQEKKTVFVTYNDQWGTHRSVAIPQTSPGGRTYLACADYRISDIDRILWHNLLQSVLTTLFFLLASIPLIVLFYYVFYSYNFELKAMNRELAIHKNHLEELVKDRTTALSLANEKLCGEIVERQSAQEELQLKNKNLQQALSEVKTLSGLLPICSYCKKIRDDQGYWNQLEEYIHNHSAAEFSHSICPSCLKEIYPNRANLSDKAE